MRSALNSADRSIQRASHVLTSIWLGGLFMGGFAAFTAVDALQVLFPPTLSAGIFPIFALMSVFLPFLLSALAVYFSVPWLLAVICGVKAFCFGFCGFGLCVVYGSCSWLLHLIFMFTDFCSLPFLYFYWLRFLRRDSRPSWATNVCFGSVLFMICTIDRCIISPFAECLQIF